MTADEIVAVISYIGELWPNYEMPSGADGWAMRTAAWSDVIGDIPADAVRSAVAELADREFAPTPGMIRKRLAEEAHGDLPSWDEFWGWASGLAQRSSLFLLQDAPPVECPWPALEGIVTARTVADWARDGLTEHDLQMVLQAHLRRLFEARVERAEKRLVPPTPALVAWRERVGALNLRADRILDPPPEPSQGVS